MSVQCTARVWRESESRESHRLLMLAIADFANEDGVAWPGQKRLAEMIRMAVSSVKRLISDLVEMGELWRGRRRDGGPNAYIVLVGLEEEELERAMQLVIDLGCDADEVRASFEEERPGIKGDTRVVSQVVPPSTTATVPDPSVSVSYPSESGLTPPSTKEQDDYVEERDLALYYRDKAYVRALGTVRNGPWEVTCPYCEGDVRVTELDKPTECICTMHSFTLLSKRPRIKVAKKPEAVEVYYSVVRSKGVRHGSADIELEKRIADTVEDIPYWHQIVVEYLAQGWNANNILTMLTYYKSRKLPGTREPGEPETSPLDKFTPVEQLDGLQESGDAAIGELPEIPGFTYVE